MNQKQESFPAGIHASALCCVFSLFVTWALQGQTPMVEAFEMIKSSDPAVASRGVALAKKAFDIHSSDWTNDAQYLIAQFSSKSDYVRQQALGLLATAAMLFPQFTLDVESQRPIFGLLRDPVMKTRIVAITTLGYLQLPKPHLTHEQTDRLMDILEDENVIVRRQAVNAILLEQPLRERTIAKIIERFEQDPDIQDTVIQILGRAKIDTRQSALLLVNLLQIRTGDSLVAILEAIEQISGQTGLETLTTIQRIAAETRDEQVRASAVRALGKLKNLNAPPR